MPSESELVSTERLRNLVKLTGDIEVDVMANLKAMLDRETKKDTSFSMKAIEIYDSDTENIPRFPAITLEFIGTLTNQRTIGKDRATFERNVEINVWYYHAEVNEKNLQLQTMTAMSRLQSIIARNADLNGYCRRGVKIGSSTLVEKTFGQRVVSSAKIPLLITIYYRDRAAGPG